MPNGRLSFLYLFYMLTVYVSLAFPVLVLHVTAYSAKLLRFMKAYVSVKVNRLMLDLCEKARCRLHVASNTQNTVCSRLSLFGVSDLFFTSGRVVIKRTCVERRNLRVTSRTI